MKRILHRTDNRITLMAVALWLLYAVGYNPWDWHGRILLGTILFIPDVFAYFGARVAGALGYEPWHFGLIQVLAGAAFVAIAVKLPFWAFGKVESK